MFETSSWRLFEDSLYNRTSGNISDDLAGECIGSKVLLNGHADK